METTATPNTVETVREAITNRPLSTDEIMEQTGLDFVAVLDSLYEVKAEMLSYGSLASGYRRLWSPR